MADGDGATGDTAEGDAANGDGAGADRDRAMDGADWNRAGSDGAEPMRKGMTGTGRR